MSIPQPHSSQAGLLGQPAPAFCCSHSCAMQPLPQLCYGDGHFWHRNIVKAPGGSPQIRILCQLCNCPSKICRLLLGHSPISSRLSPALSARLIHMLCILSELELHGTSGREMGKKLNALAYERQVLFEERYTEFSVFYGFMKYAVECNFFGVFHLHLKTRKLILIMLAKLNLQP